METDPAFHPQHSARTNPAPDSGHGTGAPARGLGESAALCVDYDLNEPRTYLGEAAGRLARYMRNLQALRQGRNRIWPTKSFGRFSTYFWDAFTVYDHIKRALATLLSPVRLEEDEIARREDPMRRYRHGRDWEPVKPKFPLRVSSRRPFTWGVKPPTVQEWAKIDATFGYDVRGTSPRTIIERARILRRKQINKVREERGLASSGQQHVETQSDRDVGIDPIVVRDYVFPNDLFAIWPPITLPKEPPVPPPLPEPHELPRTPDPETQIEVKTDDQAQHNVGAAQVTPPALLRCGDNMDDPFGTTTSLMNAFKPP